MTPSAIAALALLAAPPAAAPASALRMAANFPCLQKAVAATPPSAEAWVVLGYVEQVKGNLEGAMDDYRKAAGLGMDVAHAPLDFTLVHDVIWIQSAACAVPVPKDGADTKGASSAALPADPLYPPALENVLTEGTVALSATIGDDGHPVRIHVDSVDAGPSPVDRKRKPQEDVGERLLSRAQFALVTLSALHDATFPKADAGKSLAWSVHYLPSRDLLREHGVKIDTSMSTKLPSSYEAPPMGGKAPAPK